MPQSVRNVSTSHLPSSKSNYSVIIPAAGLGNRMSTYGAKSLIKLNNQETVVQRQIALIDGALTTYEIIVVAGFQSERLLHHLPRHVKSVVNPNYESTNIVDSIRLGLELATSSRLLIIHGDLVFNKQCLKAPFDVDSMAILAQMPRDDEVGCVTQNGYIENISYALPSKWAQIVYLAGTEANLYRDVVLDPNNAHLYHFEALNAVIDAGGRFKAISPKNARAIDIDTSKDIGLAEQI